MRGAVVTTEIKLPQWGMSMGEGTVTQWYVSVGDEVEAGQPLVEIEAAKVTDDVSSPTAGTVQEILVDVDDTVEVNTVLCVVGDGAVQQQAAPQDGDESPSETTSTSPTESERRTSENTSHDAGAPRGIEEARKKSGRITGVVPLARKLAKEHDIDLAQIDGSGTSGRIVTQDVRDVIEGRDAAPADDQAQEQPSTAEAGGVSPEGETREKIPRLRKVIADRMHASLSDTAQYTLTTTADITDFETFRDDVGGGVTKPSYMDAVLRAVAAALGHHPLLNSRLEDDSIVDPGVINLGFAVALEDGLVVPVIHNAERLGLAEMAETTRELATRARDQDLGADDFDGGTFSITALGGQGIDFFTPIINPPQSAILGIGRVREVPTRFGSGFVWRHELPLSLTVDHRLNDGYPAALFLAEVVDLLGQPNKLL
ncbi:hypothetical protein DCC26_04070 [Auritidibacter sp. NML120779]|nr:hypothetical protein DCC26_04070 [Auritidibacter sp. NML120779]